MVRGHVSYVSYDRLLPDGNGGSRKIGASMRLEAGSSAAEALREVRDLVMLQHAEAAREEALEQEDALAASAPPAPHPDYSDELPRCKVCKGSGRTIFNAPCPSCEGTGVEYAYIVNRTEVADPFAEVPA